MIPEISTQIKIITILAQIAHVNCQTFVKMIVLSTGPLFFTLGLTNHVKKNRVRFGIITYLHQDIMYDVD